MEVPESVSQNPDAGRLRRLIPIRSASAARAATLILFAAAAACGGGGGGGDAAPTPPPTTPPPTPPPTAALEIPKQTYSVILTEGSNSCDAEAIGDFALLARPEHDVGPTYQMLGLLEEPVPATLVGDRLTWSIPVQVDDGVVTIGADWLFAQDRHTFDGSTTFEAALNDGTDCTFSFASAGTHAVFPDAPVPPEAEETAASSLNKNAAAMASNAATPNALRPLGSSLAEPLAGEAVNTWGSAGVGIVVVPPAECLTDPVDGPIIRLQPPNAAARNFAGISGWETVWMNFEIHYTADRATADASMLVNGLSNGFLTGQVPFPGSDGTYSTETNWYRAVRTVVPPFVEQPWATEPGGWNTFSGGVDDTRLMNVVGYYFAVVNVVYMNQLRLSEGNVWDGWYRQVVPVLCEAR